MSIKSLNLRLIFFIFLLFVMFFKNAISKNNYVVTTVNKLPITKFDVLNRSKLIAYTIDNNFTLNNFENYYNQALKTLINEKIIFSAGSNINKDLNSVVLEKANKLLLIEFENSRSKLESFIKKTSVPKSTLLEKYKAQLIWGIVLKNKYKSEFSKIERNIDKIITLSKKTKNEDLYDLAEIVINRKNNSKLLEKIYFALDNGIAFTDIAKQVSISSSAKFNGKIGWKSFQNLPNFLKKKQTIINEKDIFTYIEGNKIKLIKVLVKRMKGELSFIEDQVILAQVKFPINFQMQNTAYKKIKNKLNKLLFNQNSCKTLNSLKSEDDKDINIKIIKSRIADLNPKLQDIINKTNFFESSQPIFYGNYGYAYIKCDSKKAELDKINYKNLKKSTMNKYFLIYSEKLLERLNNEANIKLIEKLK